MKKLLSIFSACTLIGISASNIISCKENTSLTKKQQENDILNAINLKNNSNKNNIKISDISNWNKPQCKNIGNNTFQINYDILVKQNLNTFLNKDYRVTEVKGEFNIYKDNITELSYILSYLPAIFSKELNNQNLFLGYGNSCVLYLTLGNFRYFMSSSTPIETLSYININNKFISLTDNDWNDIINNISKNPTFNFPSEGYSAIIIVQNGKLEYTNTVKSWNDFPIGNDGNLLSSFIDSNSIDNTNNYFINKNMLYELNDIYISKKNNETYGINNWTIKNIENLFIKSNYYWNKYIIYPHQYSLATLLYNLFNNHYKDMVFNLLNYYKYQNDNGIYLSFDNNTYQLKNIIYNSGKLT